MERIAALVIRWGAGLSLLVPLASWLTAHAIGPTPGDGAGVEFGLVVLTVGVLLVLASLVAIGALALWYAAISKGRERTARFENERVIGTAFLVILTIVAAFML